MNYSTVIFDFDGVLCHDRFYSTLKNRFPEAYEFVNKSVFGNNSEIPNQWMRGQITSRDVNKLIGLETSIPYKTITALFEESVRQMKIDNRLINFAKHIRDNGIGIAMVTNNMDIFNKITIPNHNLRSVFPIIINSSDYGYMKHDEEGKLFDIAFQKIGCNISENCLLIDDSQKARDTFSIMGGSVFAYTSYDDFEPWAKNHLMSKVDNT